VDHYAFVIPIVKALLGRRRPLLDTLTEEIRLYVLTKFLQFNQTQLGIKHLKSKENCHICRSFKGSNPASLIGWA
jgi:hypothetical protein